MPELDQNWFTEVAAEEGCAFSLKINDKLHDERSAYQRIEVYETAHFGRLMVIDGCVMLSSRDNFIYHEMLAHPALFTHSNPSRVAIIGGGDCGTLSEVLKHSTVKQAIQVELDEQVTRAAEKFFPELCRSNKDPRAELRFEDGIAWMKARPAAGLDVIIVDSTDPVGPAEGLFNEPFYRSCLAALRPGGILVQQSESPLLHQDLMASMAKRMRLAGFCATRRVFFPLPVYPSGWWSATLAGKDNPLETAPVQPDFATRYYNAAIHEGAFALPAFMQNAL